MQIRNWLKDTFVPHKGNDYTPRSLRRAAVLGMFVLVLLSFTAANLQSLIWTSSHFMVSSVLPAVIINETNQQRTDGALTALHENSLLDAAAQLKAEDMAKHQYFAHFSPAGISPWYWFNLVGYRYVHAGENLAINFTDSSAIVTAWMNSPEHRANIMSGAYTDIGVGTAEGTYQGYATVYVVQLFGSRAVATHTVSTPATTKTAAVVASSTSTRVLGIATTSPTTTSLLTQATTSTTSAAIGAAATKQGAVFLDMATTTAGRVVALGATTRPATANLLWWQLLTKPSFLLQLMYFAVGGFVLLSLLLSVVIEARRQQPMQIVFSLALLILMSGLFYLHSMISAGVTIM